MIGINRPNRKMAGVRRLGKLLVGTPAAARQALVGPRRPPLARRAMPWMQTALTAARQALIGMTAAAIGS